MSPRRLILPISLVLLVLLGLVGATWYPAAEMREVGQSSEMTALGAIEQAREWAATARQAIAQVRDYRCVLTTRERLNGRLQPEQVMDMEFRSQAFAVHLRFRAPSASAGQEVWFGIGLRGDQLRVRPAGYLGALTGLMVLDPHSATVRASSRHAITDAGFANMLERFVAAWDASATVLCGEALLDGRACRRIELGSETAEWKHATLWIEVETNLPVRVEYLDAEGRLLDEATYREIAVNVGLSDASFGG